MLNQLPILSKEVQKIIWFPLNKYITSEMNSNVEILPATSLQVKPSFWYQSMSLSSDSYPAAVKGARKVKVTYKDRETPIISVQEAVARQNFFPKKTNDLVIGNVESECYINFDSWFHIHCITLTKTWVNEQICNNDHWSEWQYDNILKHVS